MKLMSSSSLSESVAGLANVFSERQNHATYSKSPPSSLHNAFTGKYIIPELRSCVKVEVAFLGSPS